MTHKEIRALIEKRKKDWRYGNSVEAKYKAEECKDILELIDSLQEEPEEYKGILGEQIRYIDNEIQRLEKLKNEPAGIWHDSNKEPQRGSLILLIMQSGTPIVAKIIEPNHTFNHGERWAYIDELLKLSEYDR